MSQPAELAAVFAAALATALATGLGAAPLAVLGRLARAWVGVANAVAAGCMLAASGLLFFEGGRESVGQTLVGALLGAAFTARRVARALGTEARPLRGARLAGRAQGRSDRGRHHRPLRR